MSCCGLMWIDLLKHVGTLNFRLTLVGGRYTEPHVAGESPGSPQVVPGNPQGVQGVPEESLRSPPRTPWGSVLI